MSFNYGKKYLNQELYGDLKWQCATKFLDFLWLGTTYYKFTYSNFNIEKTDSPQYHTAGSKNWLPTVSYCRDTGSAQYDTALSKSRKTRNINQNQKYYYNTLLSGPGSWTVPLNRIRKSNMTLRSMILFTGFSLPLKVMQNKNKFSKVRYMYIVQTCCMINIIRLYFIGVENKIMSNITWYCPFHQHEKAYNNNEENNYQCPPV